MQKIIRSKAFYEEIKKVDLGVSKARYFKTNAAIPNRLKTTDMEERMWVMLLVKGDDFKPRNLGRWRNGGRYYLHIVQGCLRLSQANIKEKVQLIAGTTVVFTGDMWKTRHKILESETLIAVEYQKNVNDYTSSRVIEETTLCSKDLIPIQTEWLKWRYSFVREPRSLENVRENIIFIDAEFTCTDLGGQKSVLAVTLLNYEGVVLLDKRISPRSRVLRIGKQYHGISERDMRCQGDENEVLTEIHRIVYGKILIGHDLNLDIKYLFINPNNLLGIRDLSAAKVFGNLQIEKKGQFYKLMILAKKLLNLDIQQGAHTAMEDATAVRRLYILVECSWVDHIDFSTDSAQK